MSLSCIILFYTVDDQKSHGFVLESHETVNIYIYVLPLNFTTLDYHIIELLCCHYNGSVFFDFKNYRNIGPSDHRADTCLLNNSSKT